MIYTVQVTVESRVVRLGMRRLMIVLSDKVLGVGVVVVSSLMMMMMMMVY